MASDGRFRIGPKPNEDVIALLENALASAKAGHIPTIAIVVVNIVNQSEQLFAGDLSKLRSDALLGGLSRATTELASRK